MNCPQYHQYTTFCLIRPLTQAISPDQACDPLGRSHSRYLPYVMHTLTVLISHRKIHKDVIRSLKLKYQPIRCDFLPFIHLSGLAPRLGILSCHPRDTYDRSARAPDQNQGHLEEDLELVLNGLLCFARDFGWDFKENGPSEWRSCVFRTWEQYSNSSAQSPPWRRKELPRATSLSCARSFSICLGEMEEQRLSVCNNHCVSLSLNKRARGKRQGF